MPACLLVFGLHFNVCVANAKRVSRQYNVTTLLTLWIVCIWLRGFCILRQISLWVAIVPLPPAAPSLGALLAVLKLRAQVDVPEVGAKTT